MIVSVCVRVMRECELVYVYVPECELMRVFEYVPE